MNYLKLKDSKSKLHSSDPKKEQHRIEQITKARLKHSTLNRFKRSGDDEISREPIAIFHQIENKKEEKQELETLLSNLRTSYLSNGNLKIGAAVKNGDCFFDSVAQGLNELKNKGLIKSSERFNAKSLRKDCVDYAQKYKDDKNIWLYKAVIKDAGDYFVAIRNTLHGGIMEDPQTGKAIMEESDTFNKYLKNIENIAVENGPIPIWGRLNIEGKIICEKYNLKIEVIDLLDESLSDGRRIIKSEEGNGHNVVHILNYKQHFVPLLSNLGADITENVRVSKKAVYGVEDKKSSSLADPHSSGSSQSRLEQQLSGQQRFPLNHQGSLLTASDIYSRLTQATFDNDDSGNSGVWAGIEQINSYINQAIKINSNEVELAHYIAPTNFAFDSEEGIKDIAKHICKRNGINNFYGSNSELDKPFIIISNTVTVVAENPTDVNQQGGSHWISWVLLPKKYKTLSGEEVNNNKYQVLFFDSLSQKSFPEGLKKFLTEGGEITEDTTKISLSPFCTKEEIDFNDLKDLTGQQMNGSDCGWWAVYYALMTVYTGKVDFLEQLKGKKLSAIPLRTIMSLEEGPVIQSFSDSYEVNKPSNNQPQQPINSVEQQLDTKRKRSDSQPQPGPSRPPKRLRTSTSNTMEEPMDVDDSDSSHDDLNSPQETKVRSVTGLLTSYHGIAYQVQWMMVVALEAKERLSKKKDSAAFRFETKDFKTEDPDAGKFDDLVWKYEIYGQQENTIGKKYEYNFLQAKHKLGKDKKITINDLLKSKQQKDSSKKKSEEDKRPFALEKYFTSYKDKIKNGKKYKDGKINKLIIATNINLDNKLRNSLFTEAEERIPILELIKAETRKESEVWEIMEDDSYDRRKIIKKLQGTYDTIKLVDALIEEHILSNKPITEKSFLGDYFYDLLENQVISNSNKFDSKFVEDDRDLSNKARNFRNLLLKVGFRDKKENLNNMPNPIKMAEIIGSAIQSANSGGKFEVEITKRGNNGEIVGTNINMLANYVLVEDNENKIKFSNVFWEDEDNELAGNLKEFRKKLKAKLTESSLINVQDNGPDIAKKLKKYNFKITDKKFKTCKEVLVDERVFLKAVGDFDKIQVDFSKLELIGLVKDEHKLLSEGIISSNKKFNDEFKKGGNNLSQKARESRDLLLKIGFEDKRKSLNTNFKIPDPEEIAELIASQIKDANNYKVRITRHKRRLGKKLVSVDENIDRLSDYVFVEADEGIRFSRIFWEAEDKDLQKHTDNSVKKFRDSLKQELISKGLIDNNDIGVDIFNKLKKYKFTIAGKNNITKKEFQTCKEMLVSELDFWKAMEQGDIYKNIGAILPFNKELPEQSFKDIQDEIEEFFGKLRFVVNYSQDELDRFVQQRFENDLIAYKFQAQVANALNLVRGDYISTIDDVKEFFKEAENTINQLTLVGPTLEYQAIMNKYDIKFKDDDEFIKDLFIAKEKVDFFASNKKVLHLMTKKNELTSIKVFQEIQKKKEYEKPGSYIFVRLSTILLIQDKVLSAFSSKESNLLIVGCDTIDQDTKTLYEKLISIININKDKKIILIGQENDPLASKFRDNFSEEFVEKEKEDRSYFTQIEDTSNFLENKEANYQGKPVYLKEVISSDELEELSRDLVKNKKEDEAESILHELVTENKVIIGSKISQKSDSGSPAYNILLNEKTPKELKIERFTDKDVEDDLFVISGIKETVLIDTIKKKVSIDRKVLKEKICSFGERGHLNDGKQFFLLNSVNYDENIENFKALFHERPDKTIHFIEWKDNKFIWNRYYDPNFYTSRKFNQIELKVDKFQKHIEKNKIDKDIFIVSGIRDKEEFSNLYGVDKSKIALFTDDDPDGNKRIIIFNGANEEEIFKRLSSKLSNFNVHWIKNIQIQSKQKENSNHLVWRYSNGKISSLRDLIVTEKAKNNDVIYKDSDLKNIVKYTRSTVIADVPGMGKSTTLTRLSESYKNTNKYDWVIRVNLKDWKKEIDQFQYNPEKNDVNEGFNNVIEFFSAQEGLRNPFAKNLFKYRLENENNVILLLFDGFDEIGYNQKEEGSIQLIDRQEQITNLLKFLKENTKAKIVVTTRPYSTQQKKLEDVLSVLSYTFKTIEKPQRQEFLEDFWEKSVKLKYSQDKLDKIKSEKIKYDQSESERSRYQVFSENLIKKIDEFINEEESEFMGIPLQLRMLAELYSEEFEVWCSKEPQGQLDFKSLDISNVYKQFIDRKYKIYFYEKVGLTSTIISDDDLGIFKQSYEKVHKRLAFKYLFSESEESFELFFSESEKSPFIENKMPNEEKILALNRIGITQSRSKSDIDFTHRTFAEYFASKLIYERLQDKLINPNYSEESKRKMWEFFLDHILIEDQHNVIRRFIDCELVSDKISSSISDKIVSKILQKRIYQETQLHVAVREGLLGITEFLLNNSPDGYINAQDGLGSTSLHCAVRDGCLEIIEPLLEKGADVNAKTTMDFTPLHSAVEGLKIGHEKIVKLLLEKGADINAKTENNDTPLDRLKLFKRNEAFTRFYKDSKDYKIEPRIILKDKKGSEIEFRPMTVDKLIKMVGFSENERVMEEYESRISVPSEIILKSTQELFSTIKSEALDEDQKISKLRDLIKTVVLLVPPIMVIRYYILLLLKVMQVLLMN